MKKDNTLTVDTVDTVDTIDFSAVEHVDDQDLATPNRRGANNVLGLSVVNTERNGKRVKLTNALHAALGSPSTLQVAKIGSDLLIGKNLPGATKTFKFSQGKGVSTLYNQALVTYLTKQFGLDFTRQTSLSFHDVRVEKQLHQGSEITLAIVKLA